MASRLPKAVSRQRVLAPVVGGSRRYYRQRSMPTWVPLAYRGAIKDIESTLQRRGLPVGRPRGADHGSHRAHRRRVVVGKSQIHPPPVASPAARRISLKEKKSKLAMEEKEQRLVDLHKELVRLTTRYRGAFTSDQTTETAPNKSPTELRKFDENSDIGELLDLAESAVRDLSRLRSERSLLVESTKKWSSKAHRSRRFKRLPLNLPGSEDNAIHTRGLSLSEWVNNLLDGFPAKRDNNNEFMGIAMSHNDPRLGVTQELLGSVLQSLANIESQDAFQNEGGATKPGPRTASEQILLERTANRMVDLLDLVPSSEVPDVSLVKTVMEMLSRVGSLASAGSCYQLFQRYPQIQPRLRFSLVLQSYLEAARQEEGDSAKQEAANTSISLMHRHWNGNLPRHRVERIFQASTVLHCMAVAKMGPVEGACAAADRLITRALNAKNYEQLKEEILSDHPRVDTQTLPLLNFLAFLYATSGDSEKFEGAKQILAYMMHSDNREGGAGRYFVYPDVETLNAILAVLVSIYEGKPKKEVSTQAGLDDLKYGMGLLDYMLGCFEVGSWPNDKTFVLLFRLLSAVKPPDGGDQAEDLLSKMEIRRAFSRSKHDDFIIALSTYHRALRCWLETAKSGAGGYCACERALSLVDKLEVQCTPLLLTDKQARKTQVINLYNIPLRPTVPTYRLVLQTCDYVATKDNSSIREKVAGIVMSILGKMAGRGMTMPDTDLVVRLCNMLPKNSDKSLEMEKLVESISVKKASRKKPSKTKNKSRGQEKTAAADP